MVMYFAKTVRINNFIEMLHRGECMIDSKANDIPYDSGKTLAEFINYALQTYSNKLSKRAGTALQVKIKRVQESIKDSSPDTKESVLKIMDSWEGTKSEEKLKELLGHDKAENLLKRQQEEEQD